MRSLIEKFSDQKVAVIGDLMLDKYLFGEVERISPEAPIPIVRVIREQFVLGGAANTAANLSALGAKVSLFGYSGRDEAQSQMARLCEGAEIQFFSQFQPPQYSTIQKVRVIGQHQQLLRVDFEHRAEEEARFHEWAFQFFDELRTASDYRAYVVSDYQKGVVSEAFMKELFSLARSKNIPVIVDPKPDHRDFYKGAFLLTPNRLEAEEMSGIRIKNNGDAEKAGRLLNELLDANIVITRGEMGMSVFEKNSSMEHLPTEAKEVFDVSGAGDTVVAVLSLASLCGASLSEASRLANIAAGIKVSKFGTAVVKSSELLSRLNAH